MDQIKDKKILMIDDDEKLCRLVMDYLSPFGFEVETAHRGKEGLIKARENELDAIILDVMIPEIDGFVHAISTYRRVACDRRPVKAIFSNMNRQESLAKIS